MQREAAREAARAHHYENAARARQRQQKAEWHLTEARRQLAELDESD